MTMSFFHQIPSLFLLILLQTLPCNTFTLLPTSTPTTPPFTIHQSTTSTTSTPSQYSASEITVLRGLEPVRKRPGMYIGSTGPDGLHHLIWEVIDNSVDEALSGYASLITLTLNADGSCTISDDGRGIPVETHPATGVSALETVLTVLHAGGKFDDANDEDEDGSSRSKKGRTNGYKVSGGLHGVGISVVNALSEFVEVTVDRDEQRYRMRFERGVPVGSLMVLPPSIPSENDNGNWDDDDDDDERVKTLQANRNTGTTVTFLPDSQIFKSQDGTSAIEFDAEKLVTRMDEIAYLNAGLTLTLCDNRPQTTNKRMVFHHSGGLSEYIDLLCRSKTPLFGGGTTTTTNKQRRRSSSSPSPSSSENFSPDGTTILLTSPPPIASTIALRWSSDQYTESILSFCNNIRTRDGGTHVDALKTTLTRTINSAARTRNLLTTDQKNIPGEYIREGLTAICSVMIPNPEFEGQTKGRLGNPEVRSALDTALAESLQNVFDFHPAVLEAIVQKATEAQSAANAARAAREFVRRKTLLTSSVLPGKLADCATRDSSLGELFIVEGDSAAGSAKQGRDRRTQAILPLRGKILNIERASAEKIYQNSELQGLISALGLGVRGSALEDDALRYKTIVIMTDADVDGAHIRVLLLTFFYRYQRELIERGYVYVAQPPLYKIACGRKERYAYTEGDKEEVLQEFGEEKKVTIQRFKGLGEMMPDQLWSTTMDPERRKLLKVTLEDCAVADRVLGVLMGDAVGPRRDYISENAEYMTMNDLDV